MIHEAYEFQVIQGRLKPIAELCVNLKAQGYEVKKVKRKIKWPFFWISIYKVKLRRPIIIDMDVNDIIHTPINDL